MILTEDQFFDYIQCPAKYDLKYNKRIPSSESVTMQKLLDKVVKYFYSNLLDGKVCTMEQLKQKWDSICEKNIYFIDTKKNLEGMNYIINFARWASNEQPNIIDFDSSYDIITENTIFSGNMGAIRMIPNRKFELIINRFNNRTISQNDLDKMLKYTIDCYAFKEQCAVEISAIRLINHKNNEEFISSRSNNDYDRLTSSIKGVASGIENKAFYPRESIYCTSCNYIDFCKYWS